MEKVRSLGLVSLPDLIPKGQQSPDLLTNIKNFLPSRSVAILPAHGSYPKLIEAVKEKDGYIVDLTCQLVSVGQRAAERAVARGIWDICLGIENHPETNSIIKRLPPETYTFIDVRQVQAMDALDRLPYLESLGIPEDKDIAVFNQTTLSPGDLREVTGWLKNRFPRIIPSSRVLNFICYAMENRWNSVAEMTEWGMIDMLLVVGSKHSHNSQELRIKGEKDGIPSYSIDRPEEIQESWFNPSIKRVGESASASAFSEFSDPIIKYFIQRNPGIKIKQLTKTEKEDLTFSLPQEQIDGIEDFIQAAA